MMRDIHYSISTFYYGIVGTIISVTFIIQSEAMQWGSPMRIGWSDLFIFFMIGFTSSLGAILKSMAFQFEKVSVLSMIKYSNLFYSLLADLLLFHS